MKDDVIKIGFFFGTVAGTTVVKMHRFLFLNFHDFAVNIKGLL